MCRDAVGNCEGRTPATNAAMTDGTTVLWPGCAGHVLCVIEFQIEALIKLRGKILQRRLGAVDVCMADAAEGNIWRDKLCQVAASARRVSRKARDGRIVAALVTRVTGK